MQSGICFTPDKTHSVSVRIESGGRFVLGNVGMSPSTSVGSFALDDQSFKLIRGDREPLITRLSLDIEHAAETSTLRLRIELSGGTLEIATPVQTRTKRKDGIISLQLPSP